VPLLPDASFCGLRPPPLASRLLPLHLTPASRCLDDHGVAKHRLRMVQFSSKNCFGISYGSELFLVVCDLCPVGSMKICLVCSLYMLQPGGSGLPETQTRIPGTEMWGSCFLGQTLDIISENPNFLKPGIPNPKFFGKPNTHPFTDIIMMSSHLISTNKHSVPIEVVKLNFSPRAARNEPGSAPEFPISVHLSENYLVSRRMHVLDIRSITLDC
jgi:hypothetical protein